jgi:mono/diheme cytochrome c family protein
MKKIVLVISSIILVSCSSTKLVTVPNPTENDASRIATSYPGVTLAELNQGKMHFENNCGKCHGLKSPGSESESAWRSIVPKMTAKVNKKAGSEVLNAAAQESILRYVVAMSSSKKH